MAGKLSTWSGGLAIILAVGAIVLAVINNKNWIVLLFAAIFVFLISTVAKKREYK